MKKAILILLSIITFGCSKDDNPVSEQQETFTITTETSSVMPLRYVIVNTDISLTENTYIGNFGGQEMQLVKSSENELIFVAPQINSGIQLLELTIGDKKGSLSFEVTENIVQNTNETLSTELINPINELNQDITDLISNNTFSQEVSNGLISANQMLNDYLTKFNTLSEEEKTEVAKFYNANPFFTSDFLNVSARTMMNGNSDYDCFNLNSERVVLTTVTVLGFVAALPHLNAAGPIGSVTALAGFIAGVYAAHSIISAAHELLINECFIPFEHALNDSFGNSNNFEVNNNSFTNFSLTSKDRHIIASDIANSNAVVAFTLEKINVVKGKWQTLKNGVNNIISTTSNWFNSWFGSSSSDYELITYEFPNIPESSDEAENDGESEFITIENFPSDVSVEVNVASDNSINLKLNADETTLPRTITGKIKYDDGDFVTENEFNVTLNVVNFELTGIWTLSWYTDDTQTNLSQTDYIDFQNGVSDIGLPLYYIDSNGTTHDQTGSTATWNQNFNIVMVNGISTPRINLTNNYWSNIDLRFDYDSQNPNVLIGQSIGASNNGFNLKLTKQ
jgi:hypothetical protein